eukprot:2763353-Amphidinium_carterae.1
MLVSKIAQAGSYSLSDTSGRALLGWGVSASSFFATCHVSLGEHTHIELDDPPAGSLALWSSYVATPAEDAAFLRGYA